jgi:hypothetical protein
MYYYNTELAYLSFSDCKYKYYFLYNQVFFQKRHKMSHFVIYLVFIIKKWGMSRMAHPPNG